MYVWFLDKPGTSGGSELTVQFIQPYAAQTTIYVPLKIMLITQGEFYYLLSTVFVTNGNRYSWMWTHSPFK